LGTVGAESGAAGPPVGGAGPGVGDSTFAAFRGVGFTYVKDAPIEAFSIKDMGISFREGLFSVVLGRNGSGKSTVARLTNAILLPDVGSVTVGGLDTADEASRWAIRRGVGMVFQDPDNQIVGTTVEEDVAFGPENLGVPPEEIRERVEAALAAVGMEGYAHNAPDRLSGGQKQRVAIAGVLAMRPSCIVLDEATSMLDPVGRGELLELLRRLNRDEGLTVIHITHHMAEAAMADRVYVLDGGRLAMEGSPREVFKKAETLRSIGLEVPPITELFMRLRDAGVYDGDVILSADEGYERIRIMTQGLG